MSTDFIIDKLLLETIFILILFFCRKKIIPTVANIVVVWCVGVTLNNKSGSNVSSAAIFHSLPAASQRPFDLSSSAGAVVANNRGVYSTNETR